MKSFEAVIKNTINSLEHLGVTDRNHGASPYHPPNQTTAAYNPGQWTYQSPALYPQVGYPSVVYPNEQTGKLVYPPYNKEGDHLFDFSYAGYNEGWTPLPSPSSQATVTLSPGDGRSDDADRIQDAINHISKMPLNELGFRGSLLLNAGVFYVSHPIEITQSGIVMRGDAAGGTTIQATSAIDPTKTEYLIRISGDGNEMARKRISIVDEYVPVGSMRVKVADPKRFKTGDLIVVTANFNLEWIRKVGMDVIHPKGDTTKNNGWKPGRFDSFRRVMHVDANSGELYLNAPLTAAIAKWSGGGHVEAYKSKRVTLVGIEDLQFTYPTNRNRGPDEMMREEKKKVKDYRFATEMFANYVFKMDNAENCWIRNVRSVWFRNFAQLGTNTLTITLEGCNHTYPAAAPSKTPSLVGQFAFEISGQLILIDRCHAEMSFHAYSYKARINGPNVVHQSTSVGRAGDVGPHMKWSSGQLYDNCNFEGQLIIQDRFDAGSGHGWSGANSVVWNTVAHAGMIIQQPPTAQNFVIGSSEKKGKPRMPQHPWAWTESEGKKVNPPSLYLAQLHERRGASSQRQ
ncbi:hypothetical protein BC943DRAFT_317557 [Umbelopsis sp. AD052]|nr:hypothetical protein BC943DRAFT_317557 [Umbelopsis sp. AD052]